MIMDHYARHVPREAARHVFLVILFHLMVIVRHVNIYMALVVFHAIPKDARHVTSRIIITYLHLVHHVFHVPITTIHITHWNLDGIHIT